MLRRLDLHRATNQGEDEGERSARPRLDSNGPITEASLDLARCLAMHHQRHDDGTAVLLWGHCSTVRYCQPYPAGPATAEAAGDPESRGGGASVGGGAEPQIQGCIGGGLRRWSADIGGRLA